MVHTQVNKIYDVQQFEIFPCREPLQPSQTREEQSEGSIFFQKQKKKHPEKMTDKSKNFKTKADPPLKTNFLGSHFDNEFSSVIHCLMVAGLWTALHPA